MSVEELGDWLIDQGFSVDTVEAFAGKNEVAIGGLVQNL